MPTIKYLDYNGLDHFWDKIDAKKQNKLTAGAGISITGDTISATGGGTADAVDWGHITGSMSNQTDLTTALAAKADAAALDDYLPLTGGTLTGKLTGTQIETGTAAANYFQAQKFRGQGDASSYYHAIDFGYAGHDQVDFYEYGGVWNFWRNRSAAATTDVSNLALGITLNALKNKSYTYTFPDKTGTFALTSDIPTVPTVNNGQLTIQKNGSNVATFTANQSGNATANITVPTKTSDLTNDSDFVEDASYVHTDNNYTTAEKNKLAGIAAGAEVNQNAFSNVKVGTTTVAADAKTDTLELVAGSNVTLTPDATNDKVTIAATDTTYSNATTSAAGLMSSADKTKLNGIATGAEVNVQSDWNITDTSSDAFIKNKPTIPTVNNGQLTIQKNGTNVATFTANQSGNATANITVPTKTSELANDSGYTANTGTITQVKLDGENVATSGVANVQAIPTVFGTSSVSSAAGTIVPLKKYGVVNYNGSLIGTNILNLSVNRFYHCYERGATITCNYFSNPNDFCNGAYSRWDSTVNPSTAFTTTPFVLEIKKTSSFEMTDVSRLLLIGHRLYGELMATKYKIEVAYAYSNSTYSWGTIIDYDGAAVDICQKFYGLYYSEHGTSANSWHSIFGIRLTISGSTSTIFKLADVQLICGRGTEQPYESIHALSDAGGTVYGNVNITGSLQHGNYTYTLPNKNGTVAMTSDGVATATSSTYAQYLEGNGRIASADITHMYTNNDVHQRLDISSASMTTGRPAGDGFINTYMWDNNGTWDAQVYIPNSNNSNGNYGRPQIRHKNNESSWTSWKSLAYLDDVPTVPTNVSAFTNDAGYLTSIPTASASTLGGIKVGNNLTISSDGTLSANASSITVDSALSSTSTNPVQNKVINTALNGKQASLSTAQLNAANSGITSAKVTTYDGYASQIADKADVSDLANKQNLLSPGSHINITSDVISATGYVHSENPQASAAASSTITGSMIANGTITADKLATNATVKLTMSTSDIGEGAPLAANTLYGVYI